MRTTIGDGPALAFGYGARKIIALWIQAYFHYRQKFFPSKEMKVQRALGTLPCPGTLTIKVMNRLDKL